jgi:hypothetical protein
MAEAPAKQVDTQPEESRYFRSDILAADTHTLFKVPPEAVVGAWHLAGFKMDKAYTIDEIKEAVKTYLKHGRVEES